MQPLFQDLTCAQPCTKQNSSIEIHVSLRACQWLSSQSVGPRLVPARFILPHKLDLSSFLSSCPFASYPLIHHYSGSRHFHFSPLSYCVAPAPLCWLISCFREGRWKSPPRWAGFPFFLWLPLLMGKECVGNLKISLGLISPFQWPFTVCVCVND